MANAIIVYQTKSQSQWTPANTEKPRKPNSWAFRINAVPTVSHHKMNPALAAVVQIPANNESRFEFAWAFSSLFLFLKAWAPM
jgi:hypothetical protein